MTFPVIPAANLLTFTSPSPAAQLQAARCPWQKTLKRILNRSARPATGQSLSSSHEHVALFKRLHHYIVSPAMARNDRAYGVASGAASTETAESEGSESG
jgi:hypothetical protein